MGPERVHATCVVVGEAGLLLRGPSGAGKSRLALDLLLAARRAGRHAALVADDRLAVEPRHGRLIARTLPATAGLIEVRGLGLIRVEEVGLAHDPACVVRLVVDCLAEHGPRFPEPADTTTIISGVALPRIAARVEAGLADRILLLGVAGMPRP